MGNQGGKALNGFPPISIFTGVYPQVRDILELLTKCPFTDKRGNGSKKKDAFRRQSWCFIRLGFKAVAPRSWGKLFCCFRISEQDA